MWLMPVVAVAPCQCFSPGGHMTTSPARISVLGPPQHCTQPQPAVTISLWPSGWVCHAVRAPGFERDQRGGDARGIGCLEQRVDPHITAEIFRRTFGGGL